MPWNDADAALLKEYVDAGLSSNTASKRFEGRHSRNACIGKALRMGLAFHSIPPRGTGRPTSLLRQKRHHCKKDNPKPFIKPIKETVPETSETACQFNDIKAGVCRWPLWITGTRPENQFYCGAAAPCGPYCMKHFAVAYQPNRSKREPRSSFIMHRLSVNA